MHIWISTKNGLTVNLQCTKEEEKTMLYNALGLEKTLSRAIGCDPKKEVGATIVDDNDQFASIEQVGELERDESQVQIRIYLDAVLRNSNS